MKKLLLIPTDGIGEKQIARMLALELSERGIETTYDKEYHNICAAVFVADVVDDTLSRKLSELASSGITTICCCREADGSVPEKILNIERPFDVCKLCDALSHFISGEQIRPRISDEKAGIEIENGIVTYGGEQISLSKTEFILLSLLMSKKGSPISREELRRTLWPNAADTNIADVYIRYLRKKLDERFGVRLILTVRNRGYMLK